MQARKGSEESAVSPAELEELRALRFGVLPLLIPPLVHRLNNSLTVLRGACELGSGNGGMQLDSARRHSEQATQALSRLSTFVKDATETRESFDLGDALAGVRALVEPFAETQGVVLEAAQRTGSVVVRGDSRLVEQVLVTIAAGAVDVVGGSRADGGVPPRVRLSLRVSAGRAILGVTRTGGERELSSRFRLAARIAEDHGASLSVRGFGERAFGCRFVFPAAGHSEVAREPFQGGGARILLVEHEPTLRGLIKAVLEEAGYEVSIARTARESQLTDERCDLIVYDVDNDDPPPRQELGEESPRPLLLLGDPSEERPASEGIVLYKPFRPRELLEAVQSSLA